MAKKIQVDLKIDDEMSDCLTLDECKQISDKCDEVLDKIKVKKNKRGKNV